VARRLIVEDEKSINTLIKKNLELVGHICASVLDGEAEFDELER
jgi:DNA-binding response OmpR family regulator